MADRETVDAPAGIPYLVVATVRKPHGVKGEIQVMLETDRPREVFRAGGVLALGDRSGRPVGRSVVVERTRPFKDGLLVQLEQCADRTAADELREKTFLIPVSDAAPAGEDEVPYHVLVGSSVVVAGEPVGTVREVVEIGGVQLLVIGRTRGGELLVPFVKEMVVGVDSERREVVIDPPEGLMEL